MSTPIIKRSRFNNSPLLPAQLLESTTWDASSSGKFSGVENKTLMQFQGSNLEIPKKAKRKPISEIDDEEAYVPSKQRVTEEMAAHLDNLHISSDFTSHQSMDSDIAESTSYKVNFSNKELDERLRNAQRITVCEEVRKLNKTDDIIPKSLQHRSIDRCRSLVLWTPRQNFLSVFDPPASADDNLETDDGFEDMDENFSINNNNLGESSMDLDDL